MKKNESGIDRREFALQAALLALSGVTITVSACGGGGGSPTTGTPPPTTPPAGAADEIGSISANHGHTAVINAAQLAQGGVIDLDISGSAGHPHQVQLSGDEVVSIRGGSRVVKTSSTNDGHDHVVTFN